MLLLKHSLCASYKNIPKLCQNYMKFSIFAVNRNLLPENYLCNDSWDKYLSTDFIRKVDLNAFSSELDNKLTYKQLVTPLDMDILAAKAVYADNIEQLDFIENIFTKYRKTQSALFVKDSMHHAFIRSYIDLNQANRLLDILTKFFDELIFGRKKYSYSAQIAIEVMLQEFNDNPLTMALSLLSCWNYVKFLKTVKTEDDGSGTEANNKDGKVEKMLVNYLRNPYFDDHFDIKNFQHLVGKTIYFSSSNLKIDSLVVDSFKIYGLIIYEKYDKVINLLKQMAVNNKKVLKFVIDELDEKVPKLSPQSDEDKARVDDLQNLYKELDLKRLTSNDNVDLDKELEKIFQKIKAERFDKDIKDQQELIKKWSSEQETELKDQIKKFLIEEKKKSILKRLDYLEKQEEVLTFFDNIDKIRISHFNKGFPKENPSDIPIQPDETQFSQLFERHFKHYKKKNKPARLLVKSHTKKIMEESLTKLYNEKNTQNA